MSPMAEQVGGGDYRVQLVTPRGAGWRRHVGVGFFAILVLMVVLRVASLSPLIAFGLVCLAAALYVIGQLAFGEYGPDRKL